MPTQHVATLLGATCCVRLATVLRHVGCCWLKFSWANNTQHVATRRNTVAKRTQHVAPNNVATCCVGMLQSFGWGFRVHAVTSSMTLTITEVSPRSGGAASIECWRAIFSISCYLHMDSVHDEPMTGQENQKRVVLRIYLSFISNHQQNYIKGHVYCNPRAFLIKHLICYNFSRISRIPETTSQYPVSQ